ncbi:amino acid/amide ABC transporter substrate-binding protein, HAAT family [Sedimentitalea nanhaiensis]|uniref:Amino acid/amide ABC transporter substrate-binding protein, HAAT family n=1 Tax=Sedimentitalea nanhaiensis TaxID=999627 RepID=A0A1I7E716_9RHOB|nr:amino acid/amide ABC transporter substrate-binding protein, HAAT family [Sedimentitalea nanhaiensis]
MKLLLCLRNTAKSIGSNCNPDLTTVQRWPGDCARAREVSLSKMFAPLMAGLFLCVLATASVGLEVKTAVLRIDYPRLLPISRYDLRADDIGFAGAILADEDNGTTGGFLGHSYETRTIAVTPDAADAALAQILSDGIRIVALLADEADLLRLTDRAAEAGALVFNVSAPDTALRDEQCRPNLLHIAPSNAMMADAVGQFAIWKKWPEWLLISGSNPADVKLAEAYRKAAVKFGARIVQDRVFEDTGGTRRTDSGHVLVQRQLPTFTQGAPAHDMVVAADASDFFARYLSYHLWTPRPVMGSAGLRPVTFHGAHEAWGATQFQTRFEALAGRYVKPEDYNVWLALRVVGEAVTRANTADPDGIRNYVLSDAFELAAFKGQKVTFRSWNGQLRQPILLYDGQITVSVSPQEGFLHQRSALDSLGLDAPESGCRSFN